jgi:Domain of unknown function (DUF5911)
MTFQPIENYGVIGNLCTAALVSIDSSIDFFCFPEFDSPTVFAALLDPQRGGSFSLRPEFEGMQCKQMYAAESNVLVTRFLSEKAAAEVTDFMPLTATTQGKELVRIVKVIHGEVRFRAKCQPAFDYARCTHEVEQGDQRVIFRPAEKDCCCPMLLRATVPLKASSDSAIASFTLGKGKSAVFIDPGRLGSGEGLGGSASGSRSVHVAFLSLLFGKRPRSDSVARAVRPRKPDRFDSIRATTAVSGKARPMARFNSRTLARMPGAYHC